MFIQETEKDQVENQVIEECGVKDTNGRVSGKTQQFTVENATINTEKNSGNLSTRT